MLTYNALLKLDDAFAQGTPEQVAEFAYKKWYAHDYDEQQFKQQFLSGEGQLKADDLARFDPAFRQGSDDDRFEFAKRKGLFGDMDEKREAVARATFTGQGEDRSWGDVLPDLGKAVVSGSARMASGLAWLNARTSPFDGRTSDAVSDVLNKKADEVDATKSDALHQQQAIQQQAQDERKLQGMGLLRRGTGAAADALTNPMTLGDTLAESLPYIVPGAVSARVGAVGGRGVGLLRKLSEEGIEKAAHRGAAAATAVTSGVLEGTDAAKSTQNDVRQMSFDSLYQNSEDYKKLVDGGMAPDLARETVAMSASKAAFAIAAPIATVAGAVTAPFEADIFMGRPTVTSIGGALAKEPVEEFTQESGNTFGQNVGVKRYADQRQALGEGVVEAGSVGAVSGLVQGGAFKGLEHATDVVSGRMPQKRFVRDVLSRAKDGEVLTEEEIAAAKSMFPHLKDDIFANSREARDEAALLQPISEQTLSDVENDNQYTLTPDSLVQPFSIDDALKLIDAHDAAELTNNETTQQEIERRMQSPAIKARSGEMLSNVEVYDNIMRDAEANGGLSPAEEHFVSRMNSGDLKPEEFFARQNGWGIARDADPRLSMAVARAEMDAALADKSSAASLDATASGAKNTPILTPPGLAVVEPSFKDANARAAAEAAAAAEAKIPTKFKTKKSAELAAQQKSGEWEAVKVGDKAWALKAVEPAPVAEEPAPAPDTLVKPFTPEDAAAEIGTSDLTNTETMAQEAERRLQAARDKARPGEHLTNIEVYDNVMRGVEQRGEQTPAETHFIERVKSGELPPDAAFAQQNGDGIHRDTSPRLASAIAEREMVASLAAKQSTAEAPAPAATQTSQSPLTVVESFSKANARAAAEASEAAKKPSKFKTKKSAELALTQKKEGNWEVAKLNDKEWELRLAEPKPQPTTLRGRVMEMAPSLGKAKELMQSMKLRQTGDHNAMVDRAVAMMQAARTFSKYKTESEVRAAVKAGDIRKELIEAWAHAAHPQSNAKTSDTGVDVNIQQIARWGNASGAFSMKALNDEEQAAYDTKAQEAKAKVEAESKARDAENERIAELLNSRKDDIKKWYAKLTPQQRLAVLEKHGLGESLNGKTAAHRARVLANPDITMVPRSTLKPMMLGKALLNDKALMDEVLPEAFPAKEEPAAATNESLSQESLSKIDVDVPVHIAETGTTETVKQNALQAITEIDADIEKHRSLLKCLGAA